MLHALIRGKLSIEQENKEDILTSNVFGALCLCDARSHLLAFLRQARTPAGKYLFDNAAIINVEVDYVFWPTFKENTDARTAQPDLELKIQLDDGSKHHLLVEAKYRSGKSSFDDVDEEAEVKREEKEAEESKKTNDQLAKQWAHLIRTAGSDWQPALVFLTADLAMPTDSIAESKAAFKKVRKQVGEEFECYWLSWRHLGSVVSTLKTPMEKDLSALLDKLDLKLFTGFSVVSSQPFTWTFDAPASVVCNSTKQAFVGFSPVTAAQTSWAFEKNVVYNFSGFTAPEVLWRFNR